jgi:hypothetical protein
MPRSRLLSVLGWLHVALGAYVPGRLLLTYADVWGTLHPLKSWRVTPFLVDLLEPLLIGILSAVAGVLLIRRHRWAPGALFVAGGIVLIDAAFNLWIWGRMDLGLMLQTFTTSKYWRITVSRIVELSLDLGRLVGWLATLGLVYFRAGREEFPPTRPETTTAALLTWIAVAAIAESLMKGWIFAVWMIRS